MRRSSGQSFMVQFDRAVSIERPVIAVRDVSGILIGFQRLRFKVEAVYLRNASVHRINGMIDI